MTTCKWLTCSGKQCTNQVLMDGFCTRHLKQTCSICLEQVPSTNSARAKRLSCGHSFHYNCIIRWFETSDECPVCRKKQHKDPLIIFKGNIEDKMRTLYMDALKTYEGEIRRLNDRVRSVAQMRR